MKNITLLFFLMSFMAINAQVTGYVFTNEVGAYVPVSTNATELANVKADDAISAATNIGFNFLYEGASYTSFKMSSNGFVSFGNGTATLNGNDLSAVNATSRPIIAPLWDDLDGRATGGSYAGYELTGVAPNRVLTIEWRNWEWNFNSTNPVISFQVKLYETTNVVEFIYRPEAADVNPGGATIGLGSKFGSGNGSYINLTGTLAPVITSTTSVTEIVTKPVTGQIYRFTPPSCYGVIEITTTAQTTNSMVLNWTATDLQRTGEFEVRTSGGPGSGAVGLVTSGATAVGANSQLISGLLPNTNYNLYLRLSCGSAFSGWANTTGSTMSLGQIGAGIATSTQLPLNTNWGFNYSQQIYLKAEVQEAIGINNLITKVRFHFKATTSTASYKDWKIFMGNTTKTTFTNGTSWVAPTELSEVFNGEVTFPADDWMEIQLATPFIWDGVNNLVIAVHEYTPNFLNGGVFRRMDTTPNRGMSYTSDTNNPNPLSPPTGTTVSHVPQIILTGNPLPACMFPLNIRTSDLTSSSIKYTWNIHGTNPYVGVEYFLSTSPDEPESNSEPAGIVDAPVAELLLTELNENTRYYVWFRVKCSATSTSEWTNMSSFKTNSIGQIGTGDLTTASLPIQSSLAYNYSQQIYLASDVLSSVGTDRYVRTIKFHFNSTTATANYKDWKIFMGNTAKTNFAGTTAAEWIPTASMTTVFNGEVTFPDPTGDWMEITLAEPFLWDGTSNIVVGVYENTPGNTAGATFRRMDTGTNYRGLLYRVDAVASNPNPNSPPAASERFQYVPQVVLLAEQAPSCVGVSSYSFSDLTINSVKIQWTNLTTVLGTEYFYATSLAQAPIATTAPMGTVNVPTMSADLAGLTSDTQYYVWFRNKCNATDKSAWSAIPLSFKTLVRGFIGSGTATATELPMHSNWGYNYTQQIYTASEIRAAVGGTGQTAITTLKFHVTTPAVTDSFKDWKVLLGNTAKTAFASTAADQWVPISTMQQVFNGVVTFPAPTGDWMLITFAEPFIWDGTSNIVIAVNEYTPAWLNGASFRRMDTPGANRAIAYRNDGTAPDISTPPAASSTYAYVPQIIFETGVVPGCLKPIYLAASQVTKNTATINWTAPITVPANGYEYEVRTTGAPGSGAVGRFLTEIVANTVMTKALTGLTPSTEYSVYIRSKCSATNNSEWTLATKFTTKCDDPDFTVQNAAICGQGIVTLRATVTGTTGVFKWYDVATGGAVLFEGPAFTTPVLTANKSYWVSGTSGTGNTACVGERKKVDVVVSTAPALTLSTAVVTICENETSAVVSITSDVSIYNNYTWLPATGVTGSAQTGWVFNPTVTTDYVLTAKQTSGDLCEVAKQLKVTVKPLPVIVYTPTEPNHIICEGGVKEFNVDFGGESYSEIGMGTSLSGNADNNSAFINRWTSGKSQLLFTAAELTANGVSAGALKSISFNIATPGDALTNANYTVRIATTNLAQFASAAYITTGFTTVYGPSTYTHTASGWQEITFATPYNWDGASNLIVEISHSGADDFDNAQTFYTVSTTNNLLFSFNTGTPTLSKNRYNVKFKGKAEYMVTWAPATNVFTDEDATIPYVAGASAKKVYYKGQTEGYEDLVMNVSSGNGCPLVKTFNIRTVVITDAVAETQEFCGAVLISDLVATGQEGAAFKWYRQATGGVVLAPTTIVTTGTYFVTQIIGTCESTTRVPVQVIIKTKPIAPISPNRNICGTAVLSDLEVTYDTDNTLNWYDANQNPIVGDIDLQTGVYYVSQSNTVCESDRTRVNISVNPVPGIPTVTTAQIYCGISRVSNLAMQLAPGAVANWYASLESTTVLSPNDLLRTGTYYGAQMINGCVSARVAVNVSVYETVSQPVAQNQNFCTTTATVGDLQATTLPGAQVKWYNVATGGVALGSNQNLNSGLYYVSQKIGDCESARVRIGVNIVSNTVAPNARAQSFCGEAKVSELQVTVATGMVVKWYQQESGGTVLAADALLQTGTYYVSQSIYFCESPRKAVQVTVNPIPTAPTGSDLQVFEQEQNSVVGNLVLDQMNIIWFSSEEDAIANINSLATNMPLIDGNVYYGVILSSAGCTSLPFAVTVKINVPLGINDFDLTKLNYYPNPVKDILTITYKETITRVEVYSLTGQRVLTMNALDNMVLVDMSRLATATYVVKIYSNNQTQFVKIVKN
ncbi:fibronectin type III domain-containing protein [Flavobacterium sp. NKUCC04_CG]|uniref:Ig-like domain-containing protein n=1 Tax=Flavobacterium sp. NKUCC04_CG TaxID=2842121 RepID=UPI001C5AA194|nr:fibronectin type III domain-containing protein [Flavobacterium sp. NKUCC04_CG]MBW3517694.1 fibronectin type III domain-containing protein [Flavobacterium sp. NKUCC04_CG]